MCGRYFIGDLDDGLFEDILKDAFENPAKQILSEVKKGEIYPTNFAPIISLDDKEKLSLNAVKWGYPNFKNSSVIINARGETLFEKPLFRGSKRCLVPANGFFEWKVGVQNKEKHFITTKSGGFYMAGLLKFDSFVIVTIHPNEAMSGIHNRMPVMFDTNDATKWLYENDVRPLIAPFEGEMDIKRLDAPTDFIQLSLF